MVELSFETHEAFLEFIMEQGAFLYQFQVHKEGDDWMVAIPEDIWKETLDG